MGSPSRQTSASDSSLTPDEYQKFCEFFYRKTGILFNDKKGYFVDRRIAERIEKTGSECFRDYFALLRFQASGAEWQELVNVMTVNETYFLREDYQFEALVRGMLPELVGKRGIGDTVRIWSAPCSTGEEPYSIAIYILENWKRSDDFAIEILASDIDSKVLAAAQLGIFGERSIQRLSPTLRRKYFTSLGDDRFQIIRELRESIDFARINVVDKSHMSRYSKIDVIFCRNLLIYFDDMSRRETVELMYECLTPGGFICLGHSESMSRISSLFVPRKFGDTIVYQKAPTAN
ncbi:MAG: protein-glutamate O-methyltransferase CheR [Ancalomicrobiaceae bacterium]|nr:protein-glutamate O-methyltransferase CheR [Ancalomicrobiaceae bacterium]